MKNFTINSKKLKLLILVTIFINILSAQIPEGYYDNTIGKTGDTLKTALHNIIKNHIEFPYTDSGTDVWDILKETDKDTANPDNVILIYTGRSVFPGAQGGENATGNWNREHVWAKSHGDFGIEPPAGTDVHHLRPCDPSVNSSRSNYDFDNGGIQHPEATECNYDQTLRTWEARDVVKGDIARMMFYMEVRYEGDSGEPDLELVENIPSSGSNFGKLSTLIEWHNADPVDDFERNRNEVIYGYQNNRNPFIDHPEYVAVIWGNGVSISNISHTPETPLSSQSVIVTADISDSTATVILNWGNESGILTNTVSMINSANIFSGEIPIQIDGNEIFYSISAEKSGKTTTSIEYSYIVHDPKTATLPYEENFSDNIGIMYSYSVLGSQKWEQGDSSGIMNGWTGINNVNEDWLITPGFDLTSTMNEFLSFQSIKNNSPLPLSLWYSENFSGAGNPNIATWTDITDNAIWPIIDGVDNWTYSGYIDASDINSTNVHFAFKYISTSANSGTWQIDNISLTEIDPSSITPVINNVINTPINPTPTDAIIISADVTDNGEIASVTLNWGNETDSLNNDVAMTISTGNTYSGEIPTQINGTMIYYTISAIDNDANSTTTTVYSFIIDDKIGIPIPYTQGFDTNFDDWTEYSTTGNQIWEWSGLYGNPKGCMKMTGFTGSSSEENIDWLITPGFNFEDLSGIEMQFEEAINYESSVFNNEKILVSIDYDGLENPSNATWTELELNGRSSGNSWDFVSVNSIDLNSYIGNSSVYIGFKYSSTSSAAATWEIDNFSIDTSSTGGYPIIDNISHIPKAPTPTDIVSVSAEVTDDGSINSVTLNWGTESENLNNTVDMVLSTGIIYTADIPAQEDGTKIFYSVSAIDNESNTTTSEEKIYTVLENPDIINAWINEIHYDNASTDIDEAIEVVIENPWNYDLSKFQIDLYNGNGGAVYGNLITLNEYNVGDSDENYTFYYFIYPSNGIQNGAPDGMVLSYDGNIIQFLSYEGTLTATAGIANGQTSIDIGVSEDGTGSASHSLQLTGTGACYADFSWTGSLDQTFGSANDNGAQTFLQVDIDDGNDILALEFILNPAYPNPFNPSTNFSFVIEQSSHVKFEIFNSLGQKISTLIDRKLGMGFHKIQWNAEKFPTGIYFYKLSTNSDMLVGKCLLIK